MKSALGLLELTDLLEHDLDLLLVLGLLLQHLLAQILDFLVVEHDFSVELRLPLGDLSVGQVQLVLSIGSGNRLIEINKKENSFDL